MAFGDRSASEIRYSVAAARLFYLFQMKAIEIDSEIAKSTVFLQQLEQHLSGRKWLELDPVRLLPILPCFPM